MDISLQQEEAAMRQVRCARSKMGCQVNAVPVRAEGGRTRLVVLRRLSAGTILSARPTYNSNREQPRARPEQPSVAQLGDRSFGTEVMTG
jgi:hypothetical protein